MKPRPLTQAERDFRARRLTWIAVIVISLSWWAVVGLLVYAKVSA